MTKAERKEFRDLDRRVYFVEAPEQGLVKIGYALDPMQRFLNMLTNSAVPLKLLGTIPGGWEKETEIHTALDAHRSHGEWFRQCPEMDAFMIGMEECSLPAMLATRREPLDPAKLIRARELRNHPGMDKDAAT